MHEYPIEVKGQATIPLNRIVCVCGHCGNHDNQGIQIELNFRENRLIYLCSACKQENSVVFGKELPPPYPKTMMSRY